MGVVTIAPEAMSAGKLLLWVGARWGPGVWAHTQGCIRGEGTPEGPQRRLDRRLGEVAKAVGGRYCRLQMPLNLALGVTETVAGHKRAPWRGAGVTCPPPLPMHPWSGVGTQAEP